MKLNKIKSNMVSLEGGMKFDLDRAISNAIQGINEGNIRSFTVDASLNNPIVEWSNTLEDGTVNTYHILAELDYLTKPDVVSTASGSFIKRVELDYTGGGCTVDVVVLDNDMVVTINDECLIVHPNMQHYHDQRPEQHCIDFESVKEAEDKRVQVANDIILDNLTEMLQTWCDLHGVSYLSADEILASGGLTEDQEAWLHNYIFMWNVSS